MTGKLTYEELEERIKELKKEVFELRQTENALRESEEKYQLLVESLLNAVYEFDMKGKFIYVNQAATHMFGYSKDEILSGIRVEDIIAEKDKKALRKSINDILKGNIIDGERTFIRKNGTTFVGEIRSSPIYKGKDVVGVRCIIRDIEKSKHAGKEVKPEYEALDQIFKTATDGMRIIGKDFKVLRVNKAMAKLAGVSRDKAVGKKCYESFPGLLCYTPNCTLTSILGGKERIEYAVKKQREDGSIVPCILTATPFCDADGKLIGIIENYKDISQLLQAGEALRKSEEKFRSLVMNAPNVILIVSRDGTIEFINRIVPKISATREETVGKKIYDFMKLKYHGLVRKTLEQVFQTGEPGKYEMAVTTKSGERMWFETLVAPIYDEGQIVSATLITVDLTEHKRTEEALSKSEERFRALTESTSDWIWEVDEKATYTYVSPRIKEILGYEPEEIIGKTPFDLMPPEEARHVAAEFDAIAKSRKPFAQLENTNLRKDGRHVVLETSGVPIFDARGKFLGYRGIDRDITERKQAEDALRKSEERNRALLKVIPDLMLRISKDGIFLELIQAADVPPALPPSDFLNKNVFEVMPTKMAKQTIQVIEKVLKTGHVQTFEYELPSPLPKGEIRNFEARIIASGKDEVMVMVRDITERKRAEQALIKREQELEIKTNSLEEVNAALRVILKSLDEDKKELEERVLANVQELVIPLLEEVKKRKLDAEQKASIDVLESNLKDIISPFLSTLSSKYISLTPTEIHVANLIKEGKRNKDIAKLMNLSIRTIEFHRENIRKKIGIKNKKANLRTHLLSLK